MPRKKDSQLTDEHKRRISEAHTRNGAWLRASKGIMNAANAGDHERASQLLHEFMEGRQAEYAEASETVDMSSATQGDAAEMGQELDELFAETRRIWAQRDRQADISDAAIAEFSRTMRRELKALLARSSGLRIPAEPGPYSGIPTPTERRAADRARRQEI